MAQKMPVRHRAQAAEEHHYAPVHMAVDSEPLVVSDGASREAAAGLRVYPTRFWILLSFSLLGMCQCMNCFTLTSLPESSVLILCLFYCFSYRFSSFLEYMIALFKASVLIVCIFSSDFP